MKGMSTRNLLLWAFVATLVAAALYLMPNYGIAIGDTYVMRKSHLTPQSGTWDYWLQIFSNPNHGPQYRPIGFFAYFWVMGKIFNSSFAALAMVSYLFFAWSLAELLLLCRRLGWGYFSLIGISLVMVMHPVTTNILDQSFAMKYQFTLAVLIHGLRLMIEKDIPLYRWLILLVLSLLVGLSQEGAVVFPFVWLLWDLAWHRRVRWQHAFYFSLVVIYLSARIFIFKMPPQSGFMQVSWMHLPEGMSYYLNVIFSALVGNFAWSNIWPIVPFVVFLVALREIRRGEWLPAFCFLTACALIAPYAVLVNHIGHDRAYWGLLPLALFVGWCMQKDTRKSAAVLSGLVVVLILSFMVQKRKTDAYVKTMKEIELKTRDILTRLKPQKGETIAIFFDAKRKLENYWTNYLLVTGSMSHLISNDVTLYVSLNNYGLVGSRYSFYIKNGIRYFHQASTKFHVIGKKRYTTLILTDQFQVRHFHFVDLNWDRDIDLPVFFQNEEKI